MEPEAFWTCFQPQRARGGCMPCTVTARHCGGLALRITGSARDAEECESDAYLAAWRSIPPLRPVSLRAWLLRAVRSSAIDCLKHRRAQKRGGGEAEAVLQELEDCLPAPGKVETAVGRANPFGGRKRLSGRSACAGAARVCAALLWPAHPCRRSRAAPA